MGLNLRYVVLGSNNVIEGVALVATLVLTLFGTCEMTSFRRRDLRRYMYYSG